MDPRERVLREAFDFIDEGNLSFSGLLDHLAGNSPLLELADDAGFGVSDTLINILGESGQIRVDEAADLVVETDDILDGLVLTHRLSADELESGLVEATPDLNLMFLPEDLMLAGGGEVRLAHDWGRDSHEYHAHGSLTAEPGWLDGFTAGDTVAFVHGKDGLRLERVEKLGDGVAEVEAVSRVFEERWANRPGAGFDSNLIVETAVMRDLDLFRAPVPPISELLDAAGLELDGMWVGPKREAWEPAYVGLGVNRALTLAEDQGLARCCRDGLEAAVSYSVGREIDPGEANAAMSHGAVADTFMDWWRELRVLEDEDLADLAHELIEAGGRDLAGARYLLAAHHDARGEAVPAELELEQAIRDDPEHQPSLWMLAGYASDRGDLRRAISLYRRSGEDSDDGPIPFHEQLQVSFDGVGRNDPCPCGSGRKFKQCHLDQPVVPEDRRVGWMLNKVFRYMNAHHRHDAIAGLIIDALGEGLDVDELRSWWVDDFVQDIAIFEDGILEAFIADRADLLPEDEVAIFRSWAEEPLRCWELTASDGEHLVTLRDTATGDTVEMHDDVAARDLGVGELLLTRALPAFGVRWPSPAGLRVDLSWREEILMLLDDYPDPEVWVGWYDTLFEPPTLTTTDGQPLVLASATVRPAGGWDDLEQFLDDSYESSDDGWWHDVNRTGDDEMDNVVRGYLRREDDLLEIHTNAVERLDAILDAIGDRVVLIERNEVDPSDIDVDEAAIPEAVEMSPEDRAGIIEQMENRWLGESVPALGGLTPREAADDPTRREDLIALLSEFDRRSAPKGAMTFDPDSLRRKLGLE